MRKAGIFFDRIYMPATKVDVTERNKEKQKFEVVKRTLNELAYELKFSGEKDLDSVADLEEEV